MKEAEAFTEMAKRIERMPALEFAGAVVIQPPAEGGEPIVFMITEPNPDLLQFWGSVKARVEIAYAAAMEIAEKQAGGGWGRR